MAFHSVVDIHIVTDTLIKLLEDAVAAAGAVFTDHVTKDQVGVTGLAPDLLPGQSSADIMAYLSLYLFHVEVDRFQRNSPVTGPFTNPPGGGAPASRVPQIPQQPLSLNLYYLLSPYVPGNDSKAYITEQRMISVGLKALHDTPIVRLGVDKGEFTVSMEVETLDEQSRLWQGITRPLRASAVYKASVIFIQPSPVAALAEPVHEIRLNTSSAMTADGPFIGGLARLDGLRDEPVRGFDSGIAAVVEGQTFVLNGLNLDPAASLILRDDAGIETDISTWIVSATPKPVPSKPAPPSGLILTVKPGIAAGFYKILTRAGSVESNAIPLAIAPLVTRAAAAPPADTQIAPDGGGVYTINGKGFVAANTELILGSRTLIRSTTGPIAGQFRVVSATKITFMPPADLAPADPGKYHYSIRVRVNSVESAPVLFIEVVRP